MGLVSKATARGVFLQSITCGQMGGLGVMPLSFQEGGLCGVALGGHVGYGALEMCPVHAEGCWQWKPRSEFQRLSVKRTVEKSN